MFKYHFYGRRKGKPLKPAHQRALHAVLPLYTLSTEDSTANRPCVSVGKINVFLDLYPNVWLDVGCGAGEHCHNQAIENPNVAVIGCEPYINGVACLMRKLATTPCPNLRVYPGDVRDVLECLPAASLERVFLLYPDPWPKARHNRRRFVSESYLVLLSKAMQVGAELRIASDVRDYFDQAIVECPKHALPAKGANTPVCSVPWAHWQATRYETKARAAGRVCWYMVFTRV